MQAEGPSSLFPSCLPQMPTCLPWPNLRRLVVAADPPGQRLKSAAGSGVLEERQADPRNIKLPALQAPLLQKLLFPLHPQGCAHLRSCKVPASAHRLHWGFDTQSWRTNPQASHGQGVRAQEGG
jgi:hypothetical protein